MGENGKSNGRDEQGRFRPGHSGNPAGKPPGISSKTANDAWIKTLAGEIDPNSRKPYGQLLAEKLISLALDGSDPTAVRALELAFDRIEPSGPKTAVTVNNVSGELRDALQAARDRYLEVHGK